MGKQKLPTVAAPIGGGTGILTDGRLVTGVTGHGRALSISDGRVAMVGGRHGGRGGGRGGIGKVGGATHAAWWGTQQVKKPVTPVFFSPSVETRIHTFAMPFQPEFFSPFLPTLTTGKTMVEDNGRVTTYIDWMQSGDDPGTPPENHAAFFVFDEEDVVQEDMTEYPPGKAEYVTGEIDLATHPLLSYHCISHYTDNAGDNVSSFLVWYHMRKIDGVDWLVFAVCPFYVTLHPYREFRWKVDDLAEDPPPYISVTYMRYQYGTPTELRTERVTIYDGRDNPYYEDEPRTDKLSPDFGDTTPGRNTTTATINFDVPE